MKRFALVMGSSILIAGLGSAVSSLPAYAGSKTATLDFGTVESFARAANGDVVELNGEGTFTLQPKSISGDGGTVKEAFGEIPRTFTHRDAAGNVLATGIWEPTALLSYRSFGPATPEQNAFFGGLPTGSEGGKVMFKVALYVDGVHAHDGILTIVCELGQPQPNAVEASLLLVQGTQFNFRGAVHGDNIFIRR